MSLFMPMCTSSGRHRCLPTCLHTCVHTHRSTHTHVYIHVCLHTCRHICPPACLHTCLTAWLHTCRHPRRRARLHAATRTNTVAIQPLIQWPSVSRCTRPSRRPRSPPPLGLTGWALLPSTAGPCPCPLHASASCCIGLLWPVCPCSQALACRLDSSRPLGFGYPVPAPIPSATVRPGEPVLIPLPARPPLNLSNFSPQQSPPLHRPLYGHSTVQPSSQVHCRQHSTTTSTAALPATSYPHRLQSTITHVLGLGLTAPSGVSPSLSCPLF